MHALLALFSFPHYISLFIIHFRRPHPSSVKPHTSYRLLLLQTMNNLNDGLDSGGSERNRSSKGRLDSGGIRRAFSWGPRTNGPASSSQWYPGPQRVRPIFKSSLFWYPLSTAGEPSFEQVSYEACRWGVGSASPSPSTIKGAVPHRTR